jgi:hypothetical protein
MTFTFNTERSPLLNAEQLKEYFKKYLQESRNEIIACSAYITTTGIKWLRESIADKNVKCRIVTKWSPSDLLSGSSSLDIYHICKKNKWTLEIIEDLHAKFYLMDKKHLITGSLNLTGRGIGLVPISNKEFGVYLETTNDDLTNIDLLLEDSTIVDDHIYKLYEAWLLENKDFVKQKIPELPVELKNIKEKKLTKIWVTNFPWISPGEFLSNINTKSEEINHDKDLFNIYHSENAEELLKHKFLSSDIFRWFKKKVLEKENKSFYFGELSELIHNSLFDDPKPYRKNVKQLQINLLDYIKFFKIENFKFEKPNFSEKITYLS